MARSGQDLAGALDARRYMVAIAGDPDMTADLKLFAFCLNAFLADQRQRGHRGGFAREQWTTAVGEMMSPPDSLERKTLGRPGFVGEPSHQMCPAMKCPGFRARRLSANHRRPAALKRENPAVSPRAGVRFSITTQRQEKDAGLRTAATTPTRRWTNGALSGSNNGATTVVQPRPETRAAFWHVTSRQTGTRSINGRTRRGCRFPAESSLPR